jgi:hypothetical protein
MKPFIKIGYAPYCLIDYRSKIVDCSYPNMNACADQYHVHKEGVCVRNKDIKFKGGR